HVGKNELEGPLKDYFDMYDEDIYFGQKTFEKAESELVRRSLNLLFKKTGKKPEDI
ncbi:MAG TPA: stage V sporulation protein AD, partial [Clostridiales bacterium]|nr:stage V sporulation protein AD [Clostridiales bacterium]